jgi:hypothetical protein
MILKFKFHVNLREEKERERRHEPKLGLRHLHIKYTRLDSWFACRYICFISLSLLLSLSLYSFLFLIVIKLSNSITTSTGEGKIINVAFCTLRIKAAIYSWICGIEMYQLWIRRQLGRHLDSSEMRRDDDELFMDFN